MGVRKAPKTPKLLSLREINRATLARQMLLERESVTAAKAVERLAGLQAQLARPPYLALWSRLAGFRREELTKLALRRAVVRATTMRATIHLMSARDYRVWRTALQPMLSRAHSGRSKEAAGTDTAELVSTARAFFGKTPATFDALRKHFKALHPKRDERALSYSVRLHLPLVQVPVEGSEWGYPGSADFALAESWLGEKIAAEIATDDLVLRYLGAFGPASVADAQNWSGLRGLKDTFEELRPKLVTFRDEEGRELFDLPDAPRPDAGVPAPIRFLPEFDNLLLGHADRRRVIADEHRKVVFTKNLGILASYLVDGVFAGLWKITRSGKRASLTISPMAKIARPTRDALAAEGEALLRFVEPAASSQEILFAKS